MTYALVQSRKHMLDEVKQRMYFCTVIMTTLSGVKRRDVLYTHIYIHIYMCVYVYTE